MSTATVPKLSAAQARLLHDADVEAKKLAAAHEAAKKHLAELQARYLERIPISEDLEEAGKGIRVATVGGVSIRVAPMVSAETFSLKRYTDAGHAVTDEMREALKPGRPFDRWTLKPAAGPKKIGAVEPT